MPHCRTIFQFNDGLDTSVVVIDVDSANHFLPLEIADPQGYLAYGVAG